MWQSLGKVGNGNRPATQGSRVWKRSETNMKIAKQMLRGNFGAYRDTLNSGLSFESWSVNMKSFESSWTSGRLRISCKTSLRSVWAYPTELHSGVKLKLRMIPRGRLFILDKCSRKADPTLTSRPVSLLWIVLFPKETHFFFCLSRWRDENFLNIPWLNTYVFEVKEKQWLKRRRNVNLSYHESVQKNTV